MNSTTIVDRGKIVVSWYDGTTSREMNEHVFNCVLRKLNSDGVAGNKNKNGSSGSGGGKIKLEDVRLLDENVSPHGGTLVPYEFLCVYYVRTCVHEN